MGVLGFVWEPSPQMHTGWCAASRSAALQTFSSLSSAMAVWVLLHGRTSGSPEEIGTILSNRADEKLFHYIDQRAPMIRRSFNREEVMLTLQWISQHRMLYGCRSGAANSLWTLEVRWCRRILHLWRHNELFFPQGGKEAWAKAEAVYGIQKKACTALPALALAHIRLSKEFKSSRIAATGWADAPAIPAGRLPSQDVLICQ